MLSPAERPPHPHLLPARGEKERAAEAAYPHRLGAFLDVLKIPGVAAPR
jgi:hypothetical protein